MFSSARVYKHLGVGLAQLTTDYSEIMLALELSFPLWARESSF